MTTRYPSKVWLKANAINSPLCNGLSALAMTHFSRHFGALRPETPPMRVGVFFLWEETP